MNNIITPDIITNSGTLSDAIAEAEGSAMYMKKGGVPFVQAMAVLPEDRQLSRDEWDAIDVAVPYIDPNKSLTNLLGIRQVSLVSMIDVAAVAGVTAEELGKLPLVRHTPPVIVPAVEGSSVPSWYMDSAALPKLLASISSLAEPVGRALAQFYKSSVYTYEEVAGMPFAGEWLTRSFWDSLEEDVEIPFYLTWETFPRDRDETDSESPLSVSSYPEF